VKREGKGSQRKGKGMLIRLRWPAGRGLAPCASALARARLRGMELEARARDLLAAGDADAAATVVIEALGPAVLGYLCALHGEDDGEDVFAVWAEDVWKGLPGFRFEAPLRAWSYRVAWSASARFRRDPWQVRRQRLSTGAASRLAASVTRGGALPVRDERLEHLRQDLDAEDHSLLILRIDREMTWEEISAVLSDEGRALGPPALRKRYERLKERLARRARLQGLLH
jgi:RNA polymerase sigma-70 factor, ECF subfamily